MDPKVSVKVSRECSTIFSFMNTSQVGRGMSSERNEHPVESEMEGIRKISIYWHYCLKKKKKQWYQYHSYWYRYQPNKTQQYPFGTGTTLTGTGKNASSISYAEIIPKRRN